MRTLEPETSDNRLNPLETALLKDIANFYQDVALSAQIARCRVALREYSGCGFFTTLAVPDSSPAIVRAKAALNGCDVEATGLSHGAGSILFIKNGRLDFLEVFAYDDGYPAMVLDFSLKPITASAS